MHYRRRRISANVIRGEAVFETGGGDIVVQEVTGLVRASTGGGGIKIVRAGSAVIASTAGGPIQVERAAGQVTVKSSAGPIQVNSANNVQCESAGGGIQLRNISGSLRASTAGGQYQRGAAGQPPFADSFLTTGSGDITVFIPSNLGVTIHAVNESADSLAASFPIFPDSPCACWATPWWRKARSTAAARCCASRGRAAPFISRSNDPAAAGWIRI